MLLIFLGAPGSGKGTISERLVNDHNFKHISTGDIFRNMIKSRTPLGNKLKELIENGNLVDDKTTWEIAKDTLVKSNLNDNVILDGYPRNIFQGEFLSEFLNSINYDKLKIIYFEVSDKEIIKRISGRRMCPDCGRSYNIKSKKPKEDGICDIDKAKLYQRKDDMNIEARLNIYKEVTKPLINFYKKENKLVVVDGEQNINKIVDEIIGKLN